MEILNGLDLKNGKKVQKNRFGVFTQPLQFLTDKEKDEDWASWNLDWLEMQGIKQVREQGKTILKNYKLAEGIIDKADYVTTDENEYGELIDILTRDQESPLQLRFYPIIPNVIRVLMAEFAKRTSKIQFRAVDDLSYNDMMEQKRQMVEDYLMQQADAKITQKILQAGGDPQGDEAKQQRDPQQLKNLPEIEAFFKKDYKSLQEIWATHQHNVDEERFKMSELELVAFKDSLIARKEYWHFRMMEDDYNVEVLDPKFVFKHKSYNVRYTSAGNWAGFMDVLTLPDVVDLYGYLMEPEQITSLESMFPSTNAAAYTVPGLSPENYYDATKSYKDNMEGPSLAMRQFMHNNKDRAFGGDIIEELYRDGGDDILDVGTGGRLRVTTAYWKTQRKWFFLTAIDQTGNRITKYVTGDFKVTEKPMYNTVLTNEKSRYTLIFGEHIDEVWINEVWGGVRIGPNIASWNGFTNSPIEPIYLGIDSKKPSRLKFQFKGDHSMYGVKLPIEGRDFSDRNVKSMGPVDLMKPFQIQFNMVNNQIADILVDEIGTVVALDHNALPQHSMGEDWGKGNLAKAYVAMKDFSLLPFDTTMTNTESAINFQHYQVLNMEQTNRLLGRVNLAQHFKQQALEIIGITPQRLGQEIGRQDTKTGIEQSVNSSYAQTEMFYIEHSDQVMPRVHQMRTDLAQYYQSTKPSVRLQYMTSMDEKVNFTMNGTDLMLRDINVFCTTKTNQKAILEELRAIAKSNNQSGASIYDLGNIIKSTSLAELDVALKRVDEKKAQAEQAQRDHEMQMEQQQAESQEKREQAARDFTHQENQAKNQTEIIVSEIRAAGMAGAVDLNANAQSDYLDALASIQKEQQYQDTMNFKRDQEVNKTTLAREELGVKREDTQARLRMKDKDLQIARENKNKYDKPTPGKKKS